MYEIYNISNNDTLESIATKFDTTVEDLTRINGLSQNISTIPSPIIVPSNVENPYKYYTVKKGDTIYKISKDNNIEDDILLKINGLEKDDYIYPNQTILLPKNNIKIYLTKKEETLKEIIEKFNINIDIIFKENPNLILATDQIIIFKEK